MNKITSVLLPLAENSYQVSFSEWPQCSLIPLASSFSQKLRKTKDSLEERKANVGLSTLIYIFEMEEVFKSIPLFIFPMKAQIPLPVSCLYFIFTF